MTLANTRGDMIRSVLEGVAFNLRRALDILRRYADTGESVMIYGGGAKSKVWKQIFADIFECAIEGAKISQSTAALGAVVLAGVGTGIFENFDVVKKFSEAADRYEPNPMNISEYRKYYELFIKSTDYFAEYGDILYELRGDK